MSTARRSPTAHLAEPDVITDNARTAGRYLTDGVNLYRCIGTVSSAAGQMIGLEDCHSLDVTLWPVGELCARRLRTVTPAAER